VLAGRGFDYWESGLDYLRGPDLFHNFLRYQTTLLQEFRDIAERDGLLVVHARGDVSEVFRALQTEIKTVIETMSADRPVVLRERDQPTTA
jgi:dTMP kinase